MVILPDANWLVSFPSLSLKSVPSNDPALVSGPTLLPLLAPVEDGGTSLTEPSEFVFTEELDPQPIELN